jgi:ABC-type antimicrobial peptide transport system permease subunit
MGRILLIWRLVIRSIRQRPVEALLSVVAIAGATTTLALGLSLHGVTSHPYDTTRAETAGPDIVAQAGAATAPLPPPNHKGHWPSVNSKKGLAALESLTHAAGVVDHSGPYPMTFPLMHFNGQTVLAIAEGRQMGRATVDQPDVTSGTWVRSGGVVVERSFAEELRLTVGDHVTLNAHSFRVVGLAVTAALPPYPLAAGYTAFDRGVNNVASQDTGLVWVTEPAARSLATPKIPATYVLDLKLADPADAETFENARLNDGQLDLMTWLDIRRAEGQLTLPLQRALLIGSWLLGLLAIASLAVVVGSRIAAQTRRVGLLKAVGGTPRLVAWVLFVEYMALAVLAAGTGLVAAWLLAPFLTRPGAGLVGTAGAPSLTPSTVGWVLVLALAVATAAALVPSLRAARTSTTAALADAAHQPKRRPLLIAFAARLPVPLLLGLRLAARRPRRMVLTTFSVAVTLATIVALLSVHAHQSSGAQPSFGIYSRLPNPRVQKDDEVLLVLTIVLGVLASINALVITWATSVDSRRQLATARALGASPFEVSAGLSTALLLPALPGAIAGLPLGLLLMNAVSDGSTTTTPPALWLLGAVAGSLVVLGALSAIPARIGANRPAAEILQSEFA